MGAKVGKQRDGDREKVVDRQKENYNIHYKNNRYTQILYEYLIKKKYI